LSCHTQASPDRLARSIDDLQDIVRIATDAGNNKSFSIIAPHQLRISNNI
jgi:hypothetical protein